MMSKFCKLKMGASLAMLTLASGAWAQDNAGAEDDRDTIVVTGVRGALSEALTTKRNASAILDAINAEDIGKFPDQNVAESLSRVSGVTVTRDFGEGEKVSIRGTQTNQNRTLLNGVTVASTDWFTLDLPSRGFNFLILPSSLVDSLEVYKSPQANIQEGSLGGTVVLNTRKPLDLDPLTLSIQAEGQYSENSEEFDPQVSGLVSWKNGAETFGALFSYTRQERDVNRFGREVIGFVAPADPPRANNNNTNFWLPRLIGEVDFRQERVRETFFGSLQWAAGNQFEATLNVLDTTLDANSTNNNNLATIGADGAVVDLASVVTAGSGLEEGVVAATLMAPGGAGGRLQTFDRISGIEAQSYDLEAVYRGNGFELTGRAGRTESEGGAPDQRYWGFTTENAASQAIIDSMTFDQDLNFRLLTAGGQEETDEQFVARPFEFANATSTVNFEEEDYVGFDLAWDTRFGALDTVTIGGLYRDRETSRQASTTGYHWFADDDHISLEGAWADPDNLLPTADRWLNFGGNGAYFANDPDMAQTVADFSANERGADYILIDSATARAVGNPTTDVITIPNLNDTWSVQEETFAAYIRGDFETGSVSGDVGVRVVSTDVSSTGYVISGDANGAAALMTPNASLLATAFGCTPDTCSAELTTVKSSYTEILPNLNMSYDLTDDVKLRFAAARVMSRPDPQSLALRENFFVNTRAGTRGNPALDPITANQFDISFEYYFADDALLAATLFYKDVAGNLVPSTSMETRIDPNSQSNQTVDITFTTPQNGQDATIQGVEFLYQQPIADQFGVVVNYTYTDADTSQERDPVNVAGSGIVVGASDHILNLTGYYENDRFDARVSYNYRSEYLNEVAYFGAEIWTDDYGQLDVSASFDVTDFAEVTFDALNLTDENTDQFHLDPDRASKIYDNDRRFLVGVNLNF